MYFNHVRDITISGFSAEADPRSSAPAANKLFLMGKVDGSRGHALYLRFVDNSGAETVAATANFTSWLKDENSGKWTSLSSETSAPSAGVYTSDLVGTLFVQVTALSGAGSATKVEVWAAELT